MEPMDGLALLRAVRADARFRTLPFILISADAGAVRDKAADAGASLVLSKPFDANALRAAIAELALSS
jgi:two-component system, chemotaxis family, chemotaxis protein CheY